MWPFVLSIRPISGVLSRDNQAGSFRLNSVRFSPIAGRWTHTLLQDRDGFFVGGFCCRKQVNKSGCELVVVDFQ